MNFNIKLPAGNPLIKNFNAIAVKPGQKYRVRVRVVFNGGRKYSAYLAAIITDSAGREVGRYRRWITDFNDNLQEYQMTFEIPSEGGTLVIGCRVNAEAPVRSESEIEIAIPSDVLIEKVDSSENPDYDSALDYEVQRLPSLTIDQEDKLEKNLVWIFGSPRSGTTWLAELLGHYPSNTVWWEPFIGVILGAEWKNRHFDTFNKIKPDFFFSSQHLSNWTPFLRSLILMRSYSQVQTLDRKVIIKEALGSVGADIIMQTLPKSRLIFIIRDGRDTVDSNIDAHRQGAWGHEIKAIPLILTQNDRISWIKEYSELWTKLNNTILNAYNKHNPSLRLMVKYEDLRDDTFTQVNRIIEFLDEPVSEADLRRIVDELKFENIPPSKKGPGKFYRAASVGGWKDNFSSEEKELMNSIMGKTLNAMNYEI